MMVMGNKPLLLFDGNCTFCRHWVNYWQTLTEDKVDYQPFPPHERPEAVQLRLPNGPTLSGAAAVFRLLAMVPGKGIWHWLYRHVPGFVYASESIYDFVAAHRPLAHKLTHLMWGPRIARPSYQLTRWVFLRALGLVYLIAFLSLAVQIHGLVGSDGILPIASFHSGVEQNLGLERYYLAPTLTWLNTSDAFLTFLTLGGAALSILLIIGLAQIPVLVLLWAFYLSLLTAGQRFMTFQWDILLLEVGFLAIFLASWQLWPKIAKTAPPSTIIIWLYRFLLFRLIFSSGAVKLVSGDLTWRNLTALTHHYETQPIPNVVAWYVHQLPVQFQKLSTLSTLTIELAIPFLFFAPRRLRYFAAAVGASLQVIILLTGNYAFFNLLTLALIMLLLDDSFWYKIIPARLRRLPATKTARRPRIKQRLFAALAVIIILLGSIRLLSLFLPRSSVQTLSKPAAWAAPFYLVNHYGLFASMTTTRPEIIIEGSIDGQTWSAYEFKYKPGDTTRPPPQVAPHQPRLDWQMWFAALTAERSLRATGRAQFDPWLLQFTKSLLAGSPQVTDLLAHNPFPDRAPQYIRGILYDYQFTDSITRQLKDDWWQRKRLGLYLPTLTLDNFK